LLGIEPHFAVAAIDNISDPRGPRAGSFDNVHDFEDGPARSDYVLNDEDPFTLTEFKSAANLHCAVFAFRKDCTATENASHFGPDHDSTDGRGDDDLDLAVFEMFCYLSGEQMEEFWVLQDLCALEIVRTVKSGRELKMPFQQCSRVLEDLEDLFFGKFHW